MVLSLILTSLWILRLSFDGSYRPNDKLGGSGVSIDLLDVEINELNNYSNKIGTNQLIKEGKCKNIWKGSYYYGDSVKNSNECEYLALIEGLYALKLLSLINNNNINTNNNDDNNSHKIIKEKDVKFIQIRGDSQIVMRNMNSNTYNLDSFITRLQMLDNRAKDMLDSLKITTTALNNIPVECRYIPRELNIDADILASDAVDHKLSIIQNAHANVEKINNLYSDQLSLLLIRNSNNKEGMMDEWKSLYEISIESKGISSRMRADLDSNSIIMFDAMERPSSALASSTSIQQEEVLIIKIKSAASACKSEWIIAIEHIKDSSSSNNNNGWHTLSMTTSDGDLAIDFKLLEYQDASSADWTQSIIEEHNPIILKEMILALKRRFLFLDTTSISTTASWEADTWNLCAIHGNFQACRSLLGICGSMCLVSNVDDALKSVVSGGRADILQLLLSFTKRHDICYKQSELEFAYQYSKKLEHLRLSSLLSKAIKASHSSTD